MTVTLILIAASFLLQSALAWRLVSTRRELARVTSRLQRHTEALTLLTDTSETGFGAMAREIARLGEEALPARRKTARRAPAKRDKAAADTAVEPVSPSRRRGASLRLHMA